MVVITQDRDIYSPEVYAQAPPHELFAELRRTSPVHWQDIPGEPGYWAVLKHADCVTVAREPKLFSATEGGVVLENLDPVSLEHMRGMLLAMDPPKHVDYRRPLAPSFKARVINTMEDRIRTICREIMAKAAEKRDVEFVHEVTSLLPMQVVGELMGLPEPDWPYLCDLAEQNTGGKRDPDRPATNSASAEMAMYAIKFAMKRRQEDPQVDLTTLILDGDFGGKQMTDLEFGSFFVQLVTAGQDTTKGLLTATLVELLNRPDDLQALREDPSRIPLALEEVLRFANPLHYFRRTATANTVLNGTEIKAGDKVAMMYTSANRDEDVFDDPQSIDFSRNPNPHLSFGIAEHFCLGVHLARLEARVFYEELLGTFSSIELTGNPTRVLSNLNNTYETVPARLVV
jgi:cytochrome P450